MQNIHKNPAIKPQFIPLGKDTLANKRAKVIDYIDHQFIRKDEHQRLKALKLAALDQFMPKKDSDILIPQPDSEMSQNGDAKNASFLTISNSAHLDVKTFKMMENTIEKGETDLEERDEEFDVYSEKSDLNKNGEFSIIPKMPKIEDVDDDQFSEEIELQREPDLEYERLMYEM